jgi:hypothetical protein
MSRLVQLVLDRAAGDLAAAEIVQRLHVVLDDALVQVTTVAPFDTLDAGFCVARLALSDGSAERIVVFDVTARGAPDGSFCAGRTCDGVLLVGPDAGWAWSFAAAELEGLCHVDVHAGPDELRAAGLVGAVTHLLARHPHAFCDALPRAGLPPLPQDVVAHVDGHGNVTTTIEEDPPAPPGTTVRVRAGDFTAPAVVAASTAAVAPDELALVPGCSGWRRRRGGYRRFAELRVRSGSAAERLGSPPSGTPVAVEVPARSMPAARS